MEQNSDKSQECSLKIDTIWSEADENLLVKEEIVSDVEPDFINTPQESSNGCLDQDTEAQVEDESNCNGYTNTPVWQQSKKKVKSRTQRSEEAEMIMNQKLSCLHDTKNFKIVKRRLRCGDCRSLVCPECCKVMIPNLQSHFLGSGIGSSGTYLCKLCGIIFHSLCALQAHIRIHTTDTPYVCPDCGLIYNNIYFLILHLLNKCYHVYKVVRYKCKHCTGAYFSPETFVQHIQESHIHCVYRCLYCSSLFNNYDEFNYHMESLHQKQKVQYLNYFRCSLCSNMVIPRFMYQRHIAQHRENSEFYEVDYQCLCGEIYSLIGAFRSHFTYCSKKGVLPPRWSFLQMKLRSHVPHHEMFPSKETLVQPLAMSSNNEPDYNNLTLVRSSDKNMLPNEEGKTAKGDVSQKNEFIGSGDTAINLEGTRKVYRRQNDKSSEETNSKPPVNETKTQDSGKDERTSQQTSENHASVETEQNLSDTLMREPREVITVDCVNSDGIQSCRTSVESEQGENDMYKSYDHIPCDHLGYVIKAQCPESTKKTTQMDEVIVEESFSPKSYKLVTELDEKTGIISTKTVPAEESEGDDEEGNINGDDYDDLESLNFKIPTKTYCNEKNKFKVGSSLSCPFCIVLFPKHNLTFQQFRLHLESYHPDAALNITVSKEEKSQDKADTQKSENENENKADDSMNKLNQTSTSLDSSNDQTSNTLNSEKTPSFEESQNDISGNSETQPNENESEAKSVSHDTTPCNDKEENNAEEPHERSKTPIEEDCPTRDTSSGDSGQEKNEASEMEEDKMETSVTGMDMGTDSKEADSSKEENKQNISSETEKEIGRMEKKNGSADGSPEDCIEELDEEKMDETVEIPDSNEKKTLSELEYEGETSKDSNWSGISAKDSKSNSLDESKPEEKEKSRRESEVWSEFYESLMLAEKLKKKKKELPEGEEKKKSVVSDYSSKRVVKKPKRYRESSESADSNEYSDSDDEFLLKDDIVNKIYSEDTGDAEDHLNKKQLLLNKLENVDGRFVDYLFDVVTKKEKMFELYKKHSTLRANRYSHDLRSYRKKVLNGIKQRGRPLKMLRYHELLEKKEPNGEGNNKDVNQLKKKGEFSPENKTCEKKRGRPRKYDPGKLKERRRSDKEVDFIEKNFEREENEFSPSKRKRKLSSKLQYYRKMSDEKDDFSSGQVISNKPNDSNRKFTCAVCKEVFPGYSEMREHIVVHRMEENTYQCLECGECFVVRPSLEKHLHAFHKIKNTDKYITENRCCNIKKEVEEEEEEEEEEPLKENQCKVCKDQFDRAIDLTKHFRIHGMAFLKEFRKEGRSSERKAV